MEPPIFSVVGERLVARVNDRAVELHPLVNVVDDMVRPLAQLEIDMCLRLRQLEIECQRVRLPHPSRAGKNLAGREKRQQGPEYGRGELRLPSHQIILVAAESGTGVVVDIVLDK